MGTAGVGWLGQKVLVELSGQLHATLCATAGCDAGRAGLLRGGHALGVDLLHALPGRGGKQIWIGLCLGLRFQILYKTPCASLDKPTENAGTYK